MIYCIFPLYYLGIAGIRLINKDTALEILKQREITNLKIIEKINGIFREKGGDRLPPEAKALFEHPVALIRSDNQYLVKFIKGLKVDKIE